ncbi:unnamed protein product [Peniophora sp. CBMAI 1063]|nr:unnamed protein product [Peniophora sp. CBMAI 1063]
MRPKPFKAFLPSLKCIRGQVVFINTDKSRCDALVLSPSGEIILVPLPQLSLQRASELRTQWIVLLREHSARARGMAPSQLSHDSSTPLHRILERIWTWIVGPVLQALKLVIDPADADHRRSRITWCPTGPVTQLPLHAAGMYSDPVGPRAYDLVVSSYTPSLSALLRNYESAAMHPPTPNMLIVTQPNTPRLGLPLPYTMKEAVRENIGQYPWVHFACHGSQDPMDATKSAFELYHSPLTLADLMGTAADNAELAFLSACQTAVGDDKAPEESAHLAAGMLAVGFRGVVATMWSIRDADAPVVVKA